MNAIEFHDIRHLYPARGKKHPERLALSKVSFSVQGGEIFGLLGPNGGGKTTLFKILTTLLAPTDGSARLLGFDVRTEPNLVRAAIGVVFQHPSLDKKLTLRENLIHHGHLYGLRGIPLKTRIAETAGSLGVMDRLDHLVETLSGGLQRRGEIAKSLLHNPRLLLMDEPGTGLDPGARQALWAVLSDLKNTGITVLLTTHLMEEADRCDRLAILHQGRVVAIGKPADLKARIGGDILQIESGAPDELCGKLRDMCGGKPYVLDGTVQIEQKDAHRLIPQLVESFPGLIRSVKLAQPTLFDVFAKETGLAFTRADNMEAQ